MATYQPGAMLFHLTLVQQLHAQSIQNGYYFTNRDSFDDSGTATALNTLNYHFQLFVLPKIKAIQSQEVVHRSIISGCLLPWDGPMVETILETSQGDQVDESLPSYCAAVLTLRTGRGGKSNRGRSYYAGICPGFVSASRLDVGTLAGLQSLGDQLLSTFNWAAGINPFAYVIYSRKKGDTESGRPTANGKAYITQTIARSVLGTQRHRKIGIGN